MSSAAPTKPEISCRITRTLIMYVREMNGSLGNLLEGLELDETYLTDTNNWVSHAFLQILYARMADTLGDPYPVYKMAMASKRFQSLGLLDWIARLSANPKLIYMQAPRFNRFLKSNGDVHIHETGDSWVVLEDRYHEGFRKTRHDCDYTRGVLAGIPTIFDMPPAEVEEIECQVCRQDYGKKIWPDQPLYGARSCLYRIRWNSKRPPLWKRIFQRYAIYKKAIEDLQEANQTIQEKYGQVQRLATELEVANRNLTESTQQLESYMAELKASELKYRLLAENVSDTIWTVDLDTMRFTYVSPSVMRMRGYSIEEAMAQSPMEALTPESTKMALETLSSELDREVSGQVDPARSRTIEIEQYCKDGSVVPAEMQTSFLRNPDGKVVALLGVTRDISERKKAERLQQAKIAAEAANTAKTRFLSNMSHELRTPLNHIMGFTELLLGKHFGELNETQEEYLTDIYRSSRHLLSLVNDILDLSKIEAGRLELKTTEIRLKPLLEKSLSIIRDRAERKNIRLISEFDGIPESITADELRLNQIIYNLLANAVKFTGEGGTICLDARINDDRADAIEEAGADRGRKVEISVTDSGIGLDKDDLERIFTPFFQLEGSFSRKYPGTGLGLGLTRDLVEMHGGRIRAESEGLGKGATFRVTLPLNGNRSVPPPKDIAPSGAQR
jgi:PAS domain S-box-containing protein